MNYLRLTSAFLLLLLAQPSANAELKTWDGRHSIEQIEVTIVYFVPKDRKALPDWRERADYYARRITRFHEREFQGQSKLKTIVHPKPFASSRDTADLREGDANSIFFKTLREVDAGLKFGRDREKLAGAFPILLVLSEINWRPLDDFYRLRPTSEGLKFEGQLIQQRHFPGATSGGARATYLARQQKGWGLVSADGWRVPYSGTDCVAYHEGVGHTVGLPHPDKGNGSVMSLGQYRGWINESWLDIDQKERLGWKRPETPIARDDLFSRFTAVPEPRIPKPNEDVSLKLTWPKQAKVKSLRLRMQTEFPGNWKDVDVKRNASAPERITLGKFAEPTPVAFRIDAELEDGQSVELWGYLQVRESPRKPPQPRKPSIDLQSEAPTGSN